MQSIGNFSQLSTQKSQAFSSVGYKTQSLELLDPTYQTEEEFMTKMQSLSSEIPSLNTILKYRNLFTLIPSPQLVSIFGYFHNNQGGVYKPEEIGVGANAKVFVHNYNEEDLAFKTMENINLSMLDSYIQECVNQYNLIQINKDCILNFKGQVYISIEDSQANLYIPLELAEYSLYEYIQNNEITSEIYQYFYNFLIDLLVLLHSNNYAHRDIKPQNILFIKGIGWKLADFGESIKYEKREGLYKIKGTGAFLPEEIRKQINKHKEVYQNLYKNDIYAVICTLVMIKNPQFKSKDLINYMDTQILDQDLQNIQSTLNCDNGIEQLSQLRNLKLKMNVEVFKPNLRIFNTNYFLSIEKYLLFLYNSQLCMDQDFLIIIDTQLQRLQDTQRLDEHQKLQLYLTLLFPFQIHQLNNFNQSLLDHQKIIQQKMFFLDDKAFEFIYLSTFGSEDQYVNKQMVNKVKQNNIQLLVCSVKYYINIGNIELAKQLLEILGKLMLQMDFNSNLLFVYNLFHQKLHGNSLSFNENYLKEDHLNNIIQQYERKKEQNQFDKENYLNQNKIIDISTLDMIELFKPLYWHFNFIDDQIYNIVCRHIIENLGFSELSIAEDKFQLANFIKQQLIKTGFRKHRHSIRKIIFGIVKLFLKYDQFEGLLDLLYYFLNFMKFIDRLIYHYIIQVIQNLVFKLNIPIYHIKEDLNTLYVHQIQYQVEYYHIYCLIHLQENINAFCFNMIQGQQKTQQKQIQLDVQLVQELLQLLTAVKSKYQNLFQTIFLFAQFLGKIDSQNVKYLSIFVILVCKYLYGKISDSLKIKKEIIKYQFDPILLEYYIKCKQYNRITELFNQHKTKEDLKPCQQQVKHLMEVLLIKYNNLNRFNSNFAFLYPEKLVRFALNQKFRQLFDLRQHLYVASTFKRLQKRLNVRDICLKEQYLRI